MIVIKKKRGYFNDCEIFLNQFKRITITVEKYDKLEQFEKDIAIKKDSEEHYIIDNDQFCSRFKTGFGGEAALEAFLGTNALDMPIGSSKKFNISDLKPLGLECGVKTVELGKYHVVHKKPVRPEVIVIKIDDREFLICGLATLDMLKEYQDDNLIMNAKLRERGTKTGFYGYKHLLKFNNYDELKALL